MQTTSSSRPMDSFYQVIKSNEFPLVDRAYFNTGETPQPNALLVFISSTYATLLMAHFRRVGRCRSFYISRVMGDGLTVRSIPSAKDASSERTNETCHIIAFCDAHARGLRFSPLKGGRRRGSKCARELAILPAVAASVTRGLSATHPRSLSLSCPDLMGSFTHARHHQL